jgi:hypothetical protein
MDVSARFALARDRWAVDDLEAGTQEGVAEVLIPVRIEVATANEEAALFSLLVRIRQR